MALGLEYGLRDIIFLRAGKRWLNENQINGGSNVLSRGDYWRRGLAFGGGVRVPFSGQHVALDYAWQGTGELPANNHFSFEFGF